MPYGIREFTNGYGSIQFLVLNFFSMNTCKHGVVQFIGQFSMIGGYVCSQCGVNIVPFVYHKMRGYDHIYFWPGYEKELVAAIDRLDEKNKELWDSQI